MIFDESTDRIIGCGIVGPNAGDLIAEAALAIEMGADAADIGLHHPPASNPLGNHRHGCRGVRGHNHRPVPAKEENETTKETRNARISHRRGCQDTDREACRVSQGLRGDGPGRVRHQGRIGEGRNHRGPGRLRDHGPRHPGRGRAEHRPAGCGQRRYSDVGAVADGEQGVPVRD